MVVCFYYLYLVFDYFVLGKYLNLVGFVYFMRVVLQRVSSASVEVCDSVVGSIDMGVLVFLGVSSSFDEAKFDWMVDKILKLRLWGSDRKGFDLSVKDISGSILVVSQFTLFGDCKKGTKPNFSKACDYDVAREVYDRFIVALREKSGLKVESGEFGAMMNVKLENDGPVTIILDK